MCGPLFSKIHQRALSMFKEVSNQKTDATSKNQLFEYYNFALHTQDDSCTLNALKMYLVFGLGVSAPT